MKQKRAKTRSPKMRMLDQIRDLTTNQQNKIKMEQKRGKKRSPKMRMLKMGCGSSYLESKGLVLGSLIRMIYILLVAAVHLQCNFSDKKLIQLTNKNFQEN